MPLLDLLICPRCSGSLAHDADTLRCRHCGAAYSLVDDIPCFSPSDNFYDQYADVHCPFAATPKGPKALVLRTLPFWAYREWRFWRDAIPSCCRLLDLGSGRGKEIFRERAQQVIGLDSSLAFVRACRDHYDAAVLSSSPKLPFADASFDVVASSHVIGHIAPGEKELVVSEIARVLRPGGITAHIIETDSVHPTVLAAKRDPELYRKQLIEQDGHIGLELADAVIARFERHGFRLRIRRVVDAIVPSVAYYEKYLDHPGFRSLPRLAWTRALTRINRAGVIGNLAYEFGFGAFHRTVEQWVGDPMRANFIHVAFDRVA